MKVKIVESKRELLKLLASGGLGLLAGFFFSPKRVTASPAYSIETQAPIKIVPESEGGEAIVIRDYQDLANRLVLGELGTSLITEDGLAVQGDFQASLQSVAASVSLAIQPALGENWCIKNVFHEYDVDLIFTDGTNSITFDSGVGSGVYAQYSFLASNSIYISVANKDSVNSRLIGYNAWRLRHSTVENDLQSIAASGSLAIQPPAGELWLVKNIYHEYDVSINLTDGTNVLSFESDVGAGVFAKYAWLINNQVYLTISNDDSVNARLIGFDGLKLR